jgi:hypothetical protein
MVTRQLRSEMQSDKNQVNQFNADEGHDDAANPQTKRFRRRSASAPTGR